MDSVGEEDADGCIDGGELAVGLADIDGLNVGQSRPKAVDSVSSKSPPDLIKVPSTMSS